MRMNQDERRFDFHGLGLALKQAREEKGWTQAYVAELVGKTDRTIMNIENKGQHPSFNLFFAPFSGVSLNGKQCVCGHRPQTPLVGARPKPGSFGPCWPEVIASLCSLFLIPSTLHFFLLCRLRIAQQTINVCLDCQDLLHIWYSP